MYNIGDKVRVLKVPCRPDIKPFKTEVTSIGYCCFGYGVKDISGQDSVFDEWGVNESDLEPIEKTMKNTITIEEFNKVRGHISDFIPAGFETLIREDPMTYKKEYRVEDVLRQYGDSIKQKLLDAGYSPAPELIDWSKVEFGTKVKNKDMNDCSIRRFLKFENGRVWYWNETSNESWPTTSQNVTLAE